MRAHVPAAFGIAIACAPGCAEDGQSADPGLHLLLRVAGASWFEGPLAEDRGGPAISQIQRRQTIVRRGEADVGMEGRLAKGGWSIRFQLEGDPDHWTKPAGITDSDFPDERVWKAELEFSLMIPTTTGTIGTPVTVRMQAVNEDLVAGPVRTLEYTIAPDPPPSQLTVSLAWTAPVDLDLHVVTPEGIAIGPKNINSHEQVPGQVEAPDAWKMGGILDFDSNQGCEHDGRQIERAAWTTGTPTPGTYRVYANLFSPCGQQAADFVSTVHKGTEQIRKVSSTLYAFDARVHPADTAAPGLFLTEFEVP